MITLEQGRCAVKLENLGSKIKCTKVKIDKDLIDNDIKELNKKVVSTNHSEEIEEIREAIRYLSKLRNRNEVELKWKMEGGYLRNVGDELKSFDDYNIFCTDYITIDDITRNVIRINYHKLADVIAFEIMFRDLGFSNRKIEEKLNDVGIIEIVNEDKLNEFINEGAFTLSKSLNIIDSPYKSIVSNTITDYFRYKEFSCDKYKEVISFSCKRAMSIILDNILNRNEFKNKEVCVYALNETTLYIGVKNDINIADIDLDICIRIFGRHFDIAPTIQVY